MSDQQEEKIECISNHSSVKNLKIQINGIDEKNIESAQL